MQFSKTSKKTRKIAEENAAASEIATQGENSTPRTPRSSKSKSTEILHKAATKSVVSEQTTPVTEPRTMAAAAGVSASAESAITEQIATVAQKESPVVTTPAALHEQIAKLAYSYWVARGYAAGSPEQDWLRAERELTVKL